MTNLEWARNNKKFAFNSKVGICTLAYCTKYNKGSCFSKICTNCEFKSFDRCIEYLGEEHKEPIKLKQWEYDLLSGFEQCISFNNHPIRRWLHDKGYFRGITNQNMIIEDILNNYEIVPDDYDFGGNENESKEV